MSTKTMRDVAIGETVEYEDCGHVVRRRVVHSETTGSTTVHLALADDAGEECPVDEYGRGRWPGGGWLSRGAGAAVEVIDDETPGGYIATDTDPQATGAIYGIGDTPEAAIEDARYGAGPDAEFLTLRASAALIQHVRRYSGAPDDVSWTVRDGIARLDAEIDLEDAEAGR